MENPRKASSFFKKLVSAILLFAAIPCTAWAHGEQLIFGFGIGLFSLVGLIVFCIFWKEKWWIKLVLLVVHLLSVIAWPISIMVGKLFYYIGGDNVALIVAFGLWPLLVCYVVYRIIKFLLPAADEGKRFV